MKVFLSSTYVDLIAHRRLAIEALERLGQQVDRMEVFGARPEEATTASLNEVVRCDLFVGIYAHRYGSLAPGTDRSITETEYRHAVTRETPVFCFLVDDDHPWLPKMVEGEPGAKKLESFTAVWSKALYRVSGGPGADATDAEAEDDAVRGAQATAYQAELLDAIRAHPSVGPMTANPLMLTVLAVVHWSRKKLPEQRAELYDAAVEYLLESRATLSEVPNPLRRECLQVIALRMFEAPTGVRRTISRAEAAGAVAPLLGVDQVAALAFLEDEELHSGIVVSRTEGELEFWHLTFQEYLAALGLSCATTTGR